MRANALLRSAIGVSLLVLLLAGLLVVVARDRAAAAGSTPDLAIAIDVGGGGDDCDTRPSTGIGATCTVGVGSMFTVQGRVDSHTGISGTGGYGGIHFRFNHSAGLTLMPRAMVTELGPAGSPYWPICDSRSESTPSGGYEAICHSSGPVSMLAPIKVLEVDYTCTTAGMQTITMLDSSTFLYNSSHVPDNSDKEGDEVLTVTCTSAVGGIAQLPAMAGSSATAAEEASSDNNVLFAIAALVSVSVLAGGALCYARVRVR